MSRVLVTGSLSRGTEKRLKPRILNVLVEMAERKRSDKTKKHGRGSHCKEIKWLELKASQGS